MDILATYTTGITVLIPVFSALTCGALLLLSLRDCLTNEERRLKYILLAYLSISGLGWYMTFCYEFHPELFTWLNVVCLLSFVLPSIFFYRIVRYLTRLEQPERFSYLHYLLPGLLAAAMFVWSLFVPIDVQTEIVKNKATVLPQEYGLYARFFTLKPLLRVIFGMTYYVLTIAVLVHYYKRVNEEQTLVRKSSVWVVFLVGISIASLLSSLLPTFMPRAKILHSFWTLMASCAMAFQHLLLSYHIIRRKYRLYVIRENEPGEKRSAQTEAAAENKPETETKPEEPETTPQRRCHNGKLTRARFESYFREKKPYLDPACKMINLVEAFDVNRTVISAFINKTYGMNLNRYLNHWRMKELERLRSLPSNKGKSAGALIEKAGFDNYRTYLRAAAAEREAAAQKNPDKKEGGAQ